MFLTKTILFGSRRAKSQAKLAEREETSDGSPFTTDVSFAKPKQDPSSPRQLENHDRIMDTAIRRQILTEDRIYPIVCSGEQTSKVITRRQCSLAFSEVRAQPQELVAEIYGFRRITVSQIGTLIYHQKLLEIFSSQDGVSTLAAGVVPVMEYGHYRDLVRRYLRASSDPGSLRQEPATRNDSQGRAA